MKFCKNLQKVVEMSDPDWVPYWTNYKLLKKLIKGLPSLVHPEASSTEKNCDDQLQPCSSEESGKSQNGPVVPPKITSMKSLEARAAIGKSPGEIKFFKHLHAELKKAIYFFGRVEEEFIIREERVRDGMEIIKKTNAGTVASNTTEKWSTIAKSFYRLYKDLLLLETYAIMTYCSFSKILKKHDKVTGYNTRCAFMNNVVDKANFANYPRTLEMLKRTQALYQEATEVSTSEGTSSLHEDERLFINMIHRLNEQVISSEQTVGATDSNLRNESRRSSEESLRAQIERFQQESGKETMEENRKKRILLEDDSPGSVSDESCISKKIKSAR